MTDLVRFRPVREMSLTELQDYLEKEYKILSKEIIAKGMYYLLMRYTDNLNNNHNVSENLISRIYRISTLVNSRQSSDEIRLNQDEMECIATLLTEVSKIKEADYFTPVLREILENFVISEF